MPLPPEDDCGHGISYDDECEQCEALGVLARSVGALTPKEIGLFEKGYKMGQELRE